MEGLPPWVKRINTQASGGEVNRLFFYLCKELHVSYLDLLEMPVPAILGLSEELQEHARREEKAMKKHKR